MAGRCGCSSSNATGASITAGACVTVSGAGTTDSPAVIGVEVDPDPSNNLECGSGGLFAAGAQVQAVDDCLTVSGDGSEATPYEVGVVVSPSVGNMLACSPDGRDPGLYVTPNPYMLGATPLFAGPAPADPHNLSISGTYVGTTNVAGHIIVPITVTLLGIYTIDFSLGDVPLTLSIASIDFSTVALDHFDVVFQAADGSGPVSGGTYRINYRIDAWYAP